MTTMPEDLRTNLLYFGDNLEWLRQQGRFPDASVDLIYLDPPFNSNRSYNVLFKESDVRESEAQIHAFEDTWAWDREGRVQDVFNEFMMQAPEKAARMLRALVEALGYNDVTAYLTMMAPRLMELHRVLKPTGSLYLHCDPTASHYLKIMLDSIFGPKMFRNEVSWKRTSAHNDAAQGLTRFGRTHDVLLFYSKSSATTFNHLYAGYDPPYLSVHYRYVDAETGRRYDTSDLTAAKPGDDTRYEWHGVPPPKGRFWAYSRANMETFEAQGRLVYGPRGVPRLKNFLDDMPGVVLGDCWDDVFPINSQAKERLGYPTQKPLALLERIISASSNPGDVVLDPFCGCGTAVHAAHKLGRRWIGIDITPVATDLIRRRMEDAFAELKVKIEGWPADMAGAIALAGQDDKYYFQDWGVIEVGGRPAGEKRKKGEDGGVDGIIPFLDGKVVRRAIISVKANDKVLPTFVRDLSGVLNKDPEHNVLGVLVMLVPPTRGMMNEARQAGVWVDSNGRRWSKI